MSMSSCDFHNLAVVLKASKPIRENFELWTGYVIARQQWIVTVDKIAKMFRDKYKDDFTDADCHFFYRNSDYYGD
jgi:hypothetical protein